MPVISPAKPRIGPSWLVKYPANNSEQRSAPPLTGRVSGEFLIAPLAALPWQWPNSRKENRRLLLSCGFIALVAVLLVVFIIGAYNSLVTLRNRYKNAYSQIDVQLKRRYDLIPNLVETGERLPCP